MNTQAAAERYLRDSVESAPPLQLVRMLYQGALRFLAQACAADPQSESAAFQSGINQADAIVSELRCALDHDVAPEFAANMDALYTFVQSQLTDATISRQKEPIDAAVSVLKTLLEGWMGIDLDAERQG